jgi:AGCS family alanine or glycine:cation symporter
MNLFLLARPCSIIIEIISNWEDYMDLTSITSKISGMVWGTPLIVLLVGTGVFLTFRLGFIQFRYLGLGLKTAFLPNRQQENYKGDISHFKALMTALAATIGTGNIAGVATAITLGGPGALFWMWITALFGMATKYAEAILAIKYRIVDKNGEMAGGPMYVLERGLNMKWLGIAFALFGALAGFGIGNMVQSNSIADALHSTFGVEKLVTGVTLTILASIIILGGIKSIARASGIIVPVMAAFYIIASIVILTINYQAIPGAFALIFEHAFTPIAAAGGFAGATLKMVIQKGVSRGLFSNESGMGSAPIAAAAAKTDFPGRQALVSMSGTFLDTIVVCTFTGLVIITTGAWKSGGTGAALTASAYGVGLNHGIGNLIVSVGLVFFAFSTIIGWAYYGEKCTEYLAGERAIKPYRFLWCAAVMVGAMLKLDIVWNVADILNGLMAVPNLIALLGLSGVAAAESRSFIKMIKQEKV